MQSHATTNCATEVSSTRKFFGSHPSTERSKLAKVRQACSASSRVLHTMAFSGQGSHSIMTLLSCPDLSISLALRTYDLITSASISKSKPFHRPFVPTIGRMAAPYVGSRWSVGQSVWDFRMLMMRTHHDMQCFFNTPQGLLLNTSFRKIGPFPVIIAVRLSELGRRYQAVN